MAGAEVEAVVAEHAVGDGAEEVVRDLDDRSARLAHEMLMRVVGQVVHGPAVAQVDVVDDAEVFQITERSVDRRAVDVRMTALDELSEVVGRQV